MSKVIARRIKITAGGESSYVKGFHPHKFHRAMIHMGYKPNTQHPAAGHAKAAGYAHSYTHPSVSGVVAVKGTHIARFHGDGHKGHETKLKNHDHLHAWHDSYVHEE